MKNVIRIAFFYSIGCFLMAQPISGNLIQNAYIIATKQVKPVQSTQHHPHYLEAAESYQEIIKEYGCFNSYSAGPIKKIATHLYTFNLSPDDSLPLRITQLEKSVGDDGLGPYEKQAPSAHYLPQQLDAGSITFQQMAMASHKK